jgi:hypothetical protein
MENQKEFENDCAQLRKDLATFKASLKSNDSKTKTEPRCTTRVNLTLHGDREVMSIRVKPEIKDAFTTVTRQYGLSTCHVAEGLFTGWLVAMGADLKQVYLSSTTKAVPVINLTLVRDVKRIKRFAVEEVEESVEYGHSLVTAYCPLEDKTNMVEDLSCLCKDQPSCINRACFERVLKQTEESAEPRRNDERLEKALGHRP